MEALVERPNRVEDREPRPNRALRVVFARIGPAEVDEQSIAEVLGDVAAPALDCGACGLLVLSDDVAPLLGVELLRERGRADQVAEENRELPALARRRDCCSARLGRPRRTTGRRLVTCGNQRRSAIAAELLARRVVRAAVRASVSESSATFAAEFLPGGVLCAAVSARGDHRRQFSTFNVLTRRNSLTLSLTSTRPRARAWAAICRSYGPMRAPRFSRAARTRP